MRRSAHRPGLDRELVHRLLKHFQARMPHGLVVPDVKPDTNP
jgi:hypothetical protein